jgi:hypothetical protein
MEAKIGKIIKGKHLNIILPCMLAPPSCLYFSGFPTTILYAPLLSPHVPCVLPISFLLFWSPVHYLVRGRDHEAPH